MTPTDRLQVRTVITGAALTLLTAFSLYVVYGPRLFSRWRWMRFSILMAVLTCLWTYAFAFFRSVAGDKNALNPLFFAMVVVPFHMLLMYPGTSTLGLDSDRHCFTLIFTCEVIHGLGFYVIQKGIGKHYPLAEDSSENQTHP